MSRYLHTHTHDRSIKLAVHLDSVEIFLKAPPSYLPTVDYAHTYVPHLTWMCACAMPVVTVMLQPVV